MATRKTQPSAHGSPSAAKRDFRQEVTDQIVRMLEDGVAPWQQPWNSSGLSLGMPMNPTTGRAYRGGNAMHLMATGLQREYDDLRWMTYKQAQDQGWQVRRGEKGTHIEFWEAKSASEEASLPVPGSRGEQKEKRDEEQERRFIHRIYTVFNAKQIEGIPDYQPKRPTPFEAVHSAEQILENSGAKIRHDQVDRAFYNRSRDSIHLPPKDAFQDAAGYYGTALHELAHFTGHPSRLNRATLTESYRFGDTNYAKEELRAELASVFLAAERGIPHNPEQHAAYVASWIKALREDKNEIFRAAHDASAATDYLLTLERERILDRHTDEVKPELAGEGRRDREADAKRPLEQEQQALHHDLDTLAFEETKNATLNNTAEPEVKTSAYLMNEYEIAKAYAICDEFAPIYEGIRDRVKNVEYAMAKGDFGLWADASEELLGSMNPEVAMRIAPKWRGRSDIQVESLRSFEHKTEPWQSPPASPTLTPKTAETAKPLASTAVANTGKLGVHVIQNPSRDWELVGSVPKELAYERADGRPVASKDLAAAAHAGPRIAGLKPKTWPSREAAETALAEALRTPKPAETKAEPQSVNRSETTAPKTANEAAVKPPAFERATKPKGLPYNTQQTVNELKDIWQGAQEKRKMNEIDSNYERQALAARQLGMQETTERLEGNVVDIRVLDWADNMRTRFPLLNQEDLIRYYDQGVQQARENFAVNRAVQKVNDLPDEPSITQKELSAVHDEFINSRAITDSPSAWIVAAEVVARSRGLDPEEYLREAGLPEQWLKKPEIRSEPDGVFRNEGEGVIAAGRKESSLVQERREREPATQARFDALLSLGVYDDGQPLERRQQVEVKLTERFESLSKSPAAKTMDVHALWAEAANQVRQEPSFSSFRTASQESDTKRPLEHECEARRASARAR